MGAYLLEFFQYKSCLMLFILTNKAASANNVEVETGAVDGNTVENVPRSMFGVAPEGTSAGVINADEHDTRDHSPGTTGEHFCLLIQKMLHRNRNAFLF